MKTIQLETERRIFSVSELTRNIRFLLEDKFSAVWIEGEVTNCKAHSSGHLYFSLKDEGAQVQCVMFRTENQRLGFELTEGRQVVCFGRISVYPVRGQYQLYAERIEPKGVGALQLRFEQLKEKLKNEGLFDPALKKEIPFLPSCIGVVTSLDGAALRDILHVLERRYSKVHVIVAPAQVQGPGAAATIAEAVDDLNAQGKAEVIIVTRGGGSLEDLWAFNEEAVARAIFRSEIPVISAVGHEVDFTIADFVADLRAATPSAAAEIVLPRREDLVFRIEELRKGLFQHVTARLRVWRQELQLLSESRALKDPLGIFEIQFQRLDELKKCLTTAFSTLARFQKERVFSLIARLEALGPLSTLRRGFSVALKWPEGKVLASHKEIRKGELLKTKLHEGYVISRVEETGLQ